MKSGKKGIPSEEDIPVIDIRGTANNTMSSVQKYVRDLAKEPVTKQAAVGGLTGWVVGYLSMKVGKAAATVVGSGLLIIQLAAHKGYIKVDWARVNNDLKHKAKHLEKEIDKKLGVSQGEMCEVAVFVRENVVLASSFAGGVLLGVASS